MLQRRPPAALRERVSLCDSTEIYTRTKKATPTAQSCIPATPAVAPRASHSHTVGPAFGMVEFAEARVSRMRPVCDLQLPQSPRPVDDCLHARPVAHWKVYAGACRSLAIVKDNLRCCRWPACAACQVTGRMSRVLDKMRRTRIGRTVTISKAPTSRWLSHTRS